MSAQGQSNGDFEGSSLRTSDSPEARQAPGRADLDPATTDNEESEGGNSSGTTSLFDPSQGNEHVDQDPPAWGFVVHFHNLRLDHFPTLDSMLLNCNLEITSTGENWHEIVNPILYDLEEIAEAKDPASEASSVDMVRGLIETLYRIDHFRRQLIATMFRIQATFYTTEVNYMRSLGRDDEIPVEPQAWTCLLYLWGGYRVFYWSLVHDLLPILQDWHTWAWRHPAARVDGLRLVAFLVRRRVARLRAEHSWVDPLDYMGWVWDSCPGAVDWLDW